MIKGIASLFVVGAMLGVTLVTGGCGSSRNDLSRASSQLNFGVKSARLNLWREALFRFRRASQIDPASATAANNLAVAYEGNGEFENARVAYLEALKLDKSNQYIQKNYSRFTEFYTRNKKREAKAASLKEAKETSASPVGQPPGTPQPVVPIQPAPPTVAPPPSPPSSPPSSTKPDGRPR